MPGGNRNGLRETALFTGAARVDERLLLALAVEDHVPVDDRDAVTGAGDDTLDEVVAGALGRRLVAHLTLRRGAAAARVAVAAGGRMENDEVAPPGGGGAGGGSGGHHPPA